MSVKSPPDNSAPGASTENGERIAKRMARLGLCSRRDAESWILAGRVMVNGQVLTHPAFLVGDADEIVVDGVRLGAAAPARLWRYHKPVGLLTTHRDPAGRPTIFSHLPADLPRVISVGRLDINSEGLLLLTNDGALARHLELPSSKLPRHYRVRAYGRVDVQRLAELAQGITVDDIHYGAIIARLERQEGRNSWLSMTLHEGKNREIRNVLRALDLQVNRLIRVQYGPFHLGMLPVQGVDEIPTHSWQTQLGWSPSAGSAASRAP